MGSSNCAAVTSTKDRINCCKTFFYDMGNKNSNLVVEEEVDLEELSVSISKMDQKMVQTKLDDFVRVYPNRKISKKHFKTLIIMLLPKLENKIEKVANHIFRVYDSNNDGS